jgi:hypothetical protein
METDIKEHQNRIKELMQWAGLNTRQFGINIGYQDGKAIGFVERGERKIGKNLALKICNTFKEIDYNWVLNGTGNMVKGIYPTPTNTPQTVHEKTETFTTDPAKMKAQLKCR